jgi:hypothetical protein
MNMFKHVRAWLALLALAASLPGAAHAGMILDTGTPGGGTTGALELTSASNFAAEFALGGGQTITGLAVYLTGDPTQSVGTTFTLALYDNDPLTGLLNKNNYTALQTFTATYQADGWTTVSGLNVSGLAAGNYWLAAEVGATDSALSLFLPSPVTGGTVPAVAYAFNSMGSGYTTQGAVSFGAQVTAVPLPAAGMLLGSGLFGLLGAGRRRRGNAAA